MIYFVSNIFGFPQRHYYQQVVSPLFNLPIIYISNSSGLRNINYNFTAIKTNSSDTLSILKDDFTKINLCKIDSYAIAYIDLGAFDTPWAIGDTIHCEITFIHKGRYKGQKRQWDLIIQDKSYATIEKISNIDKIMIPPYSRSLKNIRTVEVRSGL